LAPTPQGDRRLLRELARSMVEEAVRTGLVAT
jgi:hypothetical protein